MFLRRCRRGDTAGHARRGTGVDAPPALDAVCGGAPQRRQRPAAGSGGTWARVRLSTTRGCRRHDSFAVSFIPSSTKWATPAATAVGKKYHCRQMTAYRKELPAAGVAIDVKATAMLFYQSKTPRLKPRAFVSSSCRRHTATSGRRWRRRLSSRPPPGPLP